jgi:hypothetical protein
VPSAARELFIGIPIDMRIAAQKNKSVKQKVFFILTSWGICAENQSKSPYFQISHRAAGIITFWAAFLSTI